MLQRVSLRAWEIVLFLVGAIVVAFAPMAIIEAANAQQQLDSALAFICDTPEQVEWYILESERQGGSAVAETNKHFPKVDDLSCATVEIYFTVTNVVKTVLTPKGRNITVEEIKLLAVETDNGPQRVKPQTYFTMSQPHYDEGASLPIILVQHNHDEGHPDYQNWTSGKTSNCCDSKDCGDLEEHEVQETPTGTEVLVHVPGQPEKWCPVLKEHFIIKGKSPDWNKPHACIVNSGWVADECMRLMCYAGRGGI